MSYVYLSDVDPKAAAPVPAATPAPDPSMIDKVRSDVSNLSTPSKLGLGLLLVGAGIGAWSCCKK